jgi:hypothetical protein
MLDWALRYAKIGLPVFPLRVSGDLKAPHAMLNPPDDAPKGSGGMNYATTDPKTLSDWWKRSPKSGIGLNLEMAGLVALDIDVKDDGPAKLKRILNERRVSCTSPVRARTGGGGSHYLYRAITASGEPVHGVPGNLLGIKGLDLKHRGYIVVAPSPHSAKIDGIYQPTGRTYEWEDGFSIFDGLDYLCPIYPWMLERVSGSRNLTTTGGKVDADDVFAADKPILTNMSLEQMQECLDLVPNTELKYEEWFQVLCGIWHQTTGSEDGRLMAEAWSMSALKFDQAEFDKTWASLDHRNSGRAPISFAHVVKLANERRTAQAAETIADVKDKIASAIEARDKPALLQACKLIQQTDLEETERFDLKSMVADAYKKITGNKPSAGILNRLTDYQNPNRSTPTWLEHWAYEAIDNVFSKFGSPTRLAPGAFDNMFNSHLLTLRERAAGKAQPDTTASQAALNLYEIPKVERRVYAPTEEQVFTFQNQTCLNSFSTWSQPRVPAEYSQEDKAAVERLVRHFQHLVPNDRERALLISWFAYIVQEHRRPSWAIVLQSPEGEGKTFLKDMMGAVLGGENVSSVSTAIITSDFSDWAEGYLLTVIEEGKLHGDKRFSILDKMKEYITNTVISIHPKGLKPRVAMNTAAYFILTNHRDAMPVDDGDSRYFMLASPRQTPQAVAEFKAANPRYYARLFGIINNHAGAVRKFFLEYAICDEFNPLGRAPQSDEKDYVVGLNMSEVRTDIEEAIKANKSYLLCETLFDQTAFIAMGEMGEIAPTSGAMKNHLTNLGFTFLGKYRVNGVLHRYWSRTPDRFGKPRSHYCGAAIRSYISDRDTSDL